MTASSVERGRRQRRASEEPTSGASSDGLRAQGLRTRNAILEVARKLLLEGGSLEFSLRAVAARAGISISNLQYYFPTRLAVLRAIMEPAIEEYLDDFKTALEGVRPPRESFDALVAKALRDARNVEKTSLYWHFVSLASVDEECSRLLDEWYLALTRGLGQLVRSVNPDIKPAESAQIARLMIAMTDGLALQFGAGRSQTDGMRGIDARFAEVAEFLVQDRAPKKPAR